ncbi:MAG: large subunit ribosomal protein L35 [Verrucomicrobiales bacterium]|jgi:large subunit ribosomal protein L35
MARGTSKAKTRKAVAKRFKVTGTGKILRRKQGRRHLMRVKNRKRKRSLRKVGLVSSANIKAVRANMPFA